MLFGTKSVDSKAEKRPFLSHKTNNISHFVGSDPTGMPNIAEGAERDSKKEYIHFLHIAKGFAAELRTQVYIAHRIGIIDKDLEHELIEELKVISKQLHALVNSLS
jgi:hypothetical protein